MTVKNSEERGPTRKASPTPTGDSGLAPWRHVSASLPARARSAGMRIAGIRRDMPRHLANSIRNNFIGANYYRRCTYVRSKQEYQGTGAESVHVKCIVKCKTAVQRNYVNYTEKMY
ncbi:uncharacterized protein LOC105430367 [Pogonomyrmex barbatus]|uniref:Uncharacterized protein LOC105430367 n=1 Tax=Pogonomyrmex barbatus TaxID=144034 RepID=A0A6I9XBI8_9HYME|nr:uncharacterized protein LOC105430367 [Pogonomyrmex barbatus]